MIGKMARPETQAGGRQQRWSEGAARLVGLLVALGALALLVALVASALPRLWGYQSYVIHGTSMEPSIKVGSLILAKPVDVDDLQVGNIIVFRSPGNGTTVTHRIMGIREEDGHHYFQTKGDASNGTDPREVHLEDGVHRLAYQLPYLGYFVNFAGSALGIMLLVVLPALGLAALQLTKSGEAAAKGQATAKGHAAAGKD